jgi:hypothetical protein
MLPPATIPHRVALPFRRRKLISLASLRRLRWVRKHDHGSRGGKSAS